MIGAAPTLVLMYHRVASPSRDTHDLCVTPARFEAHVAHIRRHERAVRLQDATARSMRRRIAITFDDGYADNATEAAPILEAAGVPATFFVTVGLIGGSGALWWDELESLFHDVAPTARHLDLDIDGRRVLVDVGSESARARAHWAVYHRLRPLRRPLIDGVLAQVREQLGVSPTASSSHRFMTADELRATAALEHVDIGGHASTHQLLASLDEEEQREEIVNGRARLRRLTGAPVRTFAYPFGGREAFDDTSVRMVQEAGYDLACAGWRGLVRPSSDRWRLPRVVVKDWDAATFAARLDAWFKD